MNGITSVPLTTTGSGAAHMAKEIRIGIPEYTIKTEHHFVEITKSQATYGLLLPVWQWWIEFNSIAMLWLLFLRDRHLENAQCKRTDGQIGLVCHLRVGSFQIFSHNLYAFAVVLNFFDSAIEPYVNILRKRNWNAGVTITHCGMVANKLKVIILIPML